MISLNMKAHAARLTSEPFVLLIGLSSIEEAALFLFGFEVDVEGMLNG